ncbi:MAG: tetratricopeptide repeat protein [Deltaproteobacteria bacterium]|jgi:tetratricopeptide (TPR) repeat protein|nr:tetratricopeptide repeat protein [Deltaproteobacteria bacterium]
MRLYWVAFFCFLFSLVCHIDGTFAAENSKVEAYARFMQAVIENAAGRHEDAISDLQAALSRDKTAPSILLELANTSFMLHDVQAAETWLNRLLQKEPDNLKAKSMLARIYASTNRDMEALSLLESVLNGATDDKEALFMAGMVYARERDYARAIDVFKRLADMPGKEAVTANYYLAFFYKELKDYPNAIKCLEKILDINPAAASVHLALGSIYEAMFEADKAIAEYKAYLSLEPDDIRVKEQIVKILVQLGKKQEAIAYLEELKQDPKAAIQLSILYMDEGKFSEAVDTLAELARQYPDNGQIVFPLALAYEQLGNYSAAMELLKGVAPSDEFYVDSQRYLAVLTARKGDLNAAVAILQDRLKERPNVKEWLLAISLLYEEAGRLEEAETWLKKAADSYPNDAQVIFQHVMLLDKKGQKQEALSLAKRLLEIDSKNAMAMNYIGYSYAESGVNLDEAEKLIKNAIALEPDDGYITDSLGWVYFKKKEFDQALVNLERAHELIPDDPTIIEHLGDVFSAKGMYDDARKMYGKALELTKNASDKDRLTAKLSALPAQIR